MNLSNIFLTMAKTTSANNNLGFCTGTANIWQLIGYVVLAFKIVIPILLIVFGIIDLGKAVVAGKQDEVKKNITNLVWRIVAGVIIFLIPTIISLIMGFVGGFSKDTGLQSDYKVCQKCITAPNSDACSSPANKAWNGGDKD